MSDSKIIEELSEGNLVLIHAENGNFIPMLRIKKFLLSEIDITLSATPYPAFVVDGQVVDEIYISQYMYPCTSRSQAHSEISLDDARIRANGFGSKFHLLTAWEWGAYMWSVKKYWGKERGPISEENPVVNGSGSFFWRMPNLWWGAWGTTGNLYEFCDGLQLRDGDLYGPLQNNISRMNTSDSLNTTHWPQIGSVQPHANEEFETSPVFGNAPQQMLLNGALLQDYPLGQTFANEDTDALVLERGGAYHSGNEAGLGAFRFTASATAVRNDAGFRVAYVK